MRRLRKALSAGRLCHKLRRSHYAQAVLPRLQDCNARLSRRVVTHRALARWETDGNCYKRVIPLPTFGPRRKTLCPYIPSLLHNGNGQAVCAGILLSPEALLLIGARRLGPSWAKANGRAPCVSEQYRSRAISRLWHDGTCRKRKFRKMLFLLNVRENRFTRRKAEKPTRS